ncbi:hypothetical protein JRQ81_011658 [Phrynocephalus forsythii]|uniref:Uncharacterized protein n=1 Tax=Phrynocephalus forsythii TaxID=171643 RepID=A0A9Q0X8A1_9SAUR|nr:hypothetical protein JRQ81_011658 [Phrynocephalus forsythii]
MAAKAQEQSREASCSDPADERDAGSGLVAKHPDLDRNEPGSSSECSGAQHSERPSAQPGSQCPAASLQVKPEEEPEAEQDAVVPPPAEAVAPVPAPAVGEGKGAKRMMEEDDDADAEGFKEMPDVCQDARESGRAMVLPDLFGEAHQAHTSQGGGCAKVEQAVPCLSNMGSETSANASEGLRTKRPRAPRWPTSGSRSSCSSG